MKKTIDVNRQGPSGKEEGFVLVTAIVFLAILSLVGGAALYKSRVAITVSSSSVQSEAALSAANAGINYLADYWGNNATGQAELTNLFADIEKATNTSGFYNTSSVTTSGKTSMVPESIDAMITAIGDQNGDGNSDMSDVDLYIQSANTAGWVRVYTLTSTGMVDTTAWGTGTDPQVAVWTTGYTFPKIRSESYRYPYDSPASTSGCSDCSVVVYALGRSGPARRLTRSYVAFEDWTIQKFGAITNAPLFSNKQALCDATPSTTTSSGTTGVSNGVQDPYAMWFDTTQAPDSLAIASNNTALLPSNSVGYASNESTLTANNAQPSIVFDPGKLTAAGTDYPKVRSETLNDMQAQLMSGGLFATDPIPYFSSSNDQLFPLSVYREAADRIAGFADEDLTGPDNVTTYTVSTGGTPLATVAMAGKTTGTIQWSQFATNVYNSTPMYGIVRVMVPSYADKKPANKISCGAKTWIYPFVPKFTYPPSSEAGSVAGTNEVSATGGGKIIVYGMLFFDFFDDVNGDESYDPSTETLLDDVVATATAGTFKVEVPLLVNPVMVGRNPVTGSSDAVSTITRVNSYPDGAQGNSTADDAAVGTDNGAMDLIWDVRQVSKTVTGLSPAPQYLTDVHDGTGYTLPATGYKAFISTPPAGTGNFGGAVSTDLYNMLNYFYELNKAATDGGVIHYSNHANLDAIKAAPSTFYIDTKSDTSPTTNSAADLYHVFLPNGYVHGWKRALDVTGLGSVWNDSLLPSASLWHDDRARFFYVTRSGTDTYVGKDFADLPALMWSASELYVNNNVNVSGAVYTPSALYLDQLDENVRQYISGLVVLGFGGFFQTFQNSSTKDSGLMVISYDDTAIDRLPTTKPHIVTRSFYWQELQ